MKPHDRGDEAEANAVAGNGGMLRSAMEPAENRVSMVLGNAGSGIDHSDRGRLITDIRQRAANLAADGCEFYSIINQIADGFHQQVMVADDISRTPCINMKGNVPHFGTWRVEVCRVMHQFSDIDLAEIRATLPLVDFPDTQDAGDN